MKRISIEEAQQYITTKELFHQIPASFFTLEKDDEDWDVVTYYTDRKRTLTGDNEGDECVYVMSNPSMPGLLKIGYTTNTAELRSEQLSKSNGVPEPYEVLYKYPCYNGRKIEKEVHSILDECRPNKGREHFRIDIDQAINIIEKVGNSYRYQKI